MTPKASDMNFSDNCIFIDAQDCVEVNASKTASRPNTSNNNNAVHIVPADAGCEFGKTFLIQSYISL